MVVHGRQRIRKASLIEHVYGDHKLIKIEGIEGGNEKSQIQSFLDQLAHQFSQPLLKEIRFNSWREPLLQLAELVKKGAHTIFMDELQWLAGYEDTLIAELKYVWDNYLKDNPQLILVLCGSSGSFILESAVESLQGSEVLYIIDFLRRNWNGTLSSLG